jgi:hypothetical protein
VDVLFITHERPWLQWGGNEALLVSYQLLTGLVINPPEALLPVKVPQTHDRVSHRPQERRMALALYMR